MRTGSGFPVAVGTVVAALLGVVGNIAVATIGAVPSWLTPWVWAATVVLLACAVLSDLYRHRRNSVDTPTDLDAAAASVARAVKRQWQSQERLWQVHDPFPIPVRWNVGPADVTDHWANIRQAPPGADPGPLAIAGRADQIAVVYQRVPSGRLVVLGKAGAGKTILAWRFVSDLLAAEDPSNRVPVVFNVGAWDPTSTPLTTWLASQLVASHPGLAVADPGGDDLATELLATDRILPVLDGFDEIGAGLRVAALTALNRTTMPLVLTSRPEEYEAAVKAADVLTAAAVITLADVAVSDLADYLTRATRPTTPAETRWAPVLAVVTVQPPIPAGIRIATALATPLMTYLARTVYSDTPDHDPAELLDKTRFPTPEAIEDHLLDAFIPAVYREPRSTGSGRATRQPWDDPNNARRWHTYLAIHLHRLNIEDLAWWHLRDSIPRRVRVLVMGLAAGLVSGFAFGFVFALANGRFTAGFLFGCWVGLLAAFAVGLRTNGPPPRRTHYAVRGGATALTRTIAGALAAGLAVGLALAYLGSVSFGLALTFGGAVGLLLATLHTLDSLLVMTPKVDVGVGPLDLLRLDRRRAMTMVMGYVLALELAFALFVGSVAGFPEYQLDWHGVGRMSAFWLALGLALGLTYGLTYTAWGQWLILARMWLPLTRKLPWRVMVFINDAHQRGVLRQAGGMHRYRHVRLRDRLAEAST